MPKEELLVPLNYSQIHKLITFQTRINYKILKQVGSKAKQLRKTNKHLNKRGKLRINCNLICNHSQWKIIKLKTSITPKPVYLRVNNPKLFLKDRDLDNQILEKMVKMNGILTYKKES